MNRGLTLSLAFAITLLGACEQKSVEVADGGGGHWTGLEQGAGSAERPRRANDPLASVEEAARDTCRCKDAFCANDALQRVEEELARRASSLASSDRTRGNEVSKRALACATRVGVEPSTRDAGRREVVMDLPPRAPPVPTGVGRDGKGKAVKLLQAMADAICACKDTTCVADISKTMSEQLTGVLKDPSAEDGAALTAASEKMMKCMTNLTK